MEIIDLLNELENRILKGKQFFFMQQDEAIIQKKELLDLIESIRKLIEAKYQILKAKMQTESDNIDFKKLDKLKSVRLENYNENEEARDIIVQAKNHANEIKEEIDEYADQILQNLKLTVTKFQRKLTKLDDVIEMSRDRIEKTAHYAQSEEDEEIDEKK